MLSPLRILHLEDDPLDATLIQAALAADGIECDMTCVESRAAFVSALEAGEVDLVLSDFSLPAFDGLSAAEMVRTRWPAIPLILVSGTLGEELAIDSLRSGATDYVLKERLSRLAPAVRRAMAEVDERVERHRLEAQVIEAQKMEVIGQLAGGVAHDFNNILAVIMGFGELMAAGLDPGHPLQGHIDEILAASQRAAGLTRQLLIFSRKQIVQPVPLDLNKIIADLQKMLRSLIGENVKLLVRCADAPTRIRADPGYVAQVLMNLVVNARDAMPAGGTINIATSHVGQDVLLSISDTGSGMSDDVKAHLFEAFFTTKDEGKGTGLGLTTCASIVQQSGGRIEVDSVVGRGSTFKLYFPAIEPSLEAVAPATVVAPLPRGHETLLVVEDEPSVVHLARAVLQGQGYEVLTASNGQDGLHVMREHRGQPVRLVITDVVMPVMSGRIMAEWLHTTDPTLKVLFTSGYQNDMNAQSQELRLGPDFLPKPYMPAALIRKVREVLDRP
jgi:signal transduction histidine kinase